jgi:hypothetical protein
MFIVNLLHRLITEAEQEETFPLNPENHHTTLPTENLQSDLHTGMQHPHW